MDRVSQVLSSPDVVRRQAVVGLNVSQQFVERLKVMFGGSGQVGQSHVQFPHSGQSLVAGLGDVVQALAEVVTVVLAQATEPPGSGELGAFLLQGKQIFACGRNRG